MNDLIVIGAGPGGYEAAIRARQNGLRVLLFEKGEVGGTCLNRGCIPTKALLHAGEMLVSLKNAAEWGIETSVQVDRATLYQKKEEIVTSLRGGVEQLLQQNGVELLREEAMYAGEGRVMAGGEIYTAKYILLAAGSKPMLPSIPGIDSRYVLTSDEMLATPPDFKHLAILGGGVIGVEMASFCQAMGMDVTIIEAMPRILPLMDKEVSQSLSMKLKRNGATILTGTKLQRVEETKEGVSLHMEGKDSPIVADRLLVSVGRVACTQDLFAEKTDLPAMQKDRILIDADCKTSIPGVYAIGDAATGYQLAHAASAQGCRVADLIAGVKPEADLFVIPSCIYTTPEIASVGLTEEEAKSRGMDVVGNKYVMTGNGRTMISGSGRGFIKVVAERQTEKIVGAHLMCERASDIVDEFSLAITNQMTISDMLRVVRPHPTYVEGITEALGSFHARAIHVAPKRKR